MKRTSRFVRFRRYAIWGASGAIALQASPCALDPNQLNAFLQAQFFFAFQTLFSSLLDQLLFRVVG